MNDKAETGGQMVDGLSSQPIAGLGKGFDWSVLTPELIYDIAYAIKFFVPFFSSLWEKNPLPTPTSQPKIPEGGIDFQPFPNPSENPFSDESYDVLIMFCPYRNLTSWSLEHIGRFAQQASPDNKTLRCLDQYQDWCRLAYQIDYIGNEKGEGIERVYGPEPGVVWHDQIEMTHHNFYWDAHQIFIVPFGGGLLQSDLDEDYGFDIVDVSSLDKAMDAIGRILWKMFKDWSHMDVRVITSGLEGGFSTKWREPGDGLDMQHDSGVLGQITERINGALWDGFYAEAKDKTWSWQPVTRFYHDRCGRYAWGYRRWNLNGSNDITFKYERALPFKVPHYKDGSEFDLRRKILPYLSDRNLFLDEQGNWLTEGHRFAATKPLIIGAPKPQKGKCVGPWYTNRDKEIARAGRLRAPDDCDVAILLVPEHYRTRLWERNSGGHAGYTAPEWLGLYYELYHDHITPTVIGGYDGDRQRFRKPRPWAPLPRHVVPPVDPTVEGGEDEELWTQLGTMGRSFRFSEDRSQVQRNGRRVDEGESLEVREIYFLPYVLGRLSGVLQHDDENTVRRPDSYYLDPRDIADGLREVAGRITCSWESPARWIKLVKNPRRVRINVFIGMTPEYANMQYGRTCEKGFANFILNEFRAMGISQQKGFSIVFYDKYMDTECTSITEREPVFMSGPLGVSGAMELVDMHPAAPFMPPYRDGSAPAFGPVVPTAAAAAAAAASGSTTGVLIGPRPMAAAAYGRMFPPATPAPDTPPAPPRPKPKPGDPPPEPDLGPLGPPDRVRRPPKPKPKPKPKPEPKEPEEEGKNEDY